MRRANFYAIIQISLIFLLSCTFTSVANGQDVGPGVPPPPERPEPDPTDPPPPDPGPTATSTPPSGATEPPSTPEPICSGERDSNTPLCQDWAALLEAKPTLESESGNSARLNWRAELSISQWEGVTVREDRVKAVILRDKNLPGAIPTQLCRLDGLEHLELSELGLTGTIPMCLENIATLKSLNLQSNSIRGVIPPGIGRMPSLEVLDLNHNDLRGPLPATLHLLPKIHFLNLQNNDLSGPIPAEFDNLARREPPTQMTIATGNRLCGPIPQSLRALGPLYNDLSSTHFPSADMGDCFADYDAQLSARDMGDHVELRWQGLDFLPNYELWVYTAATGWEGLTLTAETLFRHTNAQRGTEYKYTVRPLTAGASPLHSPWSDYLDFSFGESDVPGIPGVPEFLDPERRGSADGFYTTVIKWDAVTHAAHYVLYTWSQATGWKQLDDGNQTSTEFIFSYPDITVGQQSWFVVMAVSSEGVNGDWSKHHYYCHGTPNSCGPSGTPVIE